MNAPSEESAGLWPCRHLMETTRRIRRLCSSSKLDPLLACYAGCMHGVACLLVRLFACAASGTTSWQHLTTLGQSSTIYSLIPHSSGNPTKRYLLSRNFFSLHLKSILPREDCCSTLLACNEPQVTALNNQAFPRQLDHSLEMSSTTGRIIPKPTGHSRLPDHFAEGFQNCQNCHSSGATRWCADCNDSTLGDIRTWYCSEQCQRQHWTEHKRVCRERRRLFRAVGLLETLWDAFARVAFSSNIQFVKQPSQGVVQLAHSHHTNDILDPRGWTGESIFYPFPGTVVPGNVGDDVQRAILCDMACSDVLAVGLGMIKALLLRMFFPSRQLSLLLTEFFTSLAVCQDICEATLRMKDPAIVTFVETEGGNWLHQVLRVKLACGEVYAVDITGAQYGWKEKLYTWNNYLRYRVDGNKIEYKALGASLSYLHATLVPYTKEGTQRGGFEIESEIAATMSQHIVSFFAREKTTARAFMSLSTSDFVARRTEFLDKIKAGLHQTINDLTVKRGIGRLYVYMGAVGPQLRVVRRDDEAEKLKNVWLTREQFEANRGHEMELAREWVKRAKSHKCEDVAGTMDLDNPNLRMGVRRWVP